MTATTAPSTELLRSPAYALAQLHLSVRDQIESSLSAEGFTVRTHQILSCLASADELSQKQVADLLGVDRSDMVRHIDKLEDQGLVTRAKNAKDRRKHILALTKSGKRALTRADGLVTGATDDALATLSDKNRRTLHRLTLQALGLPKEYAEPAP
ncbi:MarR family transcriptional regulator [Rhodococcus sp. D2-41]|uniref:MarR family transcriptional regulator n=1 Tax=Speluncibacter jeojiensis TaxID=2710754 RepID=A0A9X4RFN4_9ACTN|nr:MarR family transcriptional regulator [Rhodococcus sp. D2-41]MDG3009330.1 MarR family transcriptional regulator [Rhodococcus sp. D2-41]MDG3016883.1 MarR family transcriptional regulator [Corynebacteriales bacterium D3-21]